MHVERITRHERRGADDLVAIEEPLQVLLELGERHERRDAPLAMTMRTPGHDLDLVTGFLFGEGAIGGPEDLLDVRHCSQSESPHNVVRAKLRPGVRVPSRLLERTLPVTSACGVCGEKTIEALEKAGLAPVPTEAGPIKPDAIRVAIGALERSQTFFRNTGGTHGAALFDLRGKLLLNREDVGRHNALDKVVGAWLASAPIPAADVFVVVSSRASFELVQKTVRAGFPMLVSIGAASSLAIDTAKRFGLTLAGFARLDRFNVYAGGERIASERSEIEVIDVGAE